MSAVEDFVRVNSTHRGTTLALQLLLARERDASGQEWHVATRDQLVTMLHSRHGTVKASENRLVVNGDLEIRVATSGWPRLRSYRLIIPSLVDPVHSAEDGTAAAGAVSEPASRPEAGGEGVGLPTCGSVVEWVRLNSRYRRVLLGLQLLLARERDASGQEWHFTSRESLMAALHCTYSGIYHAEQRLVANGDLETCVDAEREWPHSRGYRLVLPTSFGLVESADIERARRPELAMFQAARQLLSQTVSIRAHDARLRAQTASDWVWASSLLSQPSFLVHLALARLFDLAGGDVSISYTELACLSRCGDDLVREAVLELVQRGLIEVTGAGERKRYRVIIPVMDRIDRSDRDVPQRSRPPRRKQSLSVEPVGTIGPVGDDGTAPAPVPDGFYAWAVRNSPYAGLPCSIHLIMAAYADHLPYGAVPDGHVQLSDADIASRVGCSLLTMRRVKARMIDDGFLEVVDDSQGPKEFNTYRILMPERHIALGVGA